MEFKKKILANGFSVVGEVNKSAKSAAVGFFVKTGARDEVQEINGVSHFLEHMLFKGTEKLSAFEVNQAFDRTGAQFNAFTSEESTVYYAAVLPEYLQDVTELWIELMRPSLRDEDFNLEKNVIKEEIAMYKDLPSFDVMDRCRSLHFQGHPCGNSVLGSEESIDNLAAEQMRNYFDARYAPNNITMTCVGNFDWEQICSVAEVSCGSWGSQAAERTLSDWLGSGKTDRIGKPNLVCEHICLMSRAVAVQDPMRFAAAILATIVGDDVGSKYFWELVDKAITETAVMQYGSMDGTGIFYSYFRCAADNAKKVLNTVGKILANLSDTITTDELQKAKNKILSALVIKNELPMGRLTDMGFNWVYLGQYRSTADDMNAIKAVTIEDVRSLIAEFTPAKFTRFSIGPDTAN